MIAAKRVGFALDGAASSGRDSSRAWREADSVFSIGFLGQQKKSGMGFRHPPLIQVPVRVDPRGVPLAK